jgi:Predicted phosphoesterase or phosphohydrolase
MIKTLYPKFQSWSNTGSIFIISDTHFDDLDCKLMDKNWISVSEQQEILRNTIHKNDTLIHLGDVGNIERLEQAWKNGKKPYSVLIMGNHDETVSKFKCFFDEIYTGPLFIAEKILLSHEPIDFSFCLNIHDHNHAGKQFPDKNHINLAANVCSYKPMNLKSIIELGYLSKINSIHRETIDNATKRKKSI